MNDEKLHIIPDPRKGYPEPEIPADEAWSEMAGLLDAEMPVSPPGSGPTSGPPSSGGGGLFGISLNFWSIALILIGIASFVTWGVLNIFEKPGIFPEMADRIDSVQNVIITGPQTHIADEHPIVSSNVIIPETIDSIEFKSNLPIQRSVSEAIDRPEHILPPGNKIMDEKSPFIAASTIVEQLPPRSEDYIPAEQLADNKIMSGNIMPDQHSFNEIKPEVTITPIEHEPNHQFIDTTFAASPAGLVAEGRTEENTEADEKSDDTLQPGEPGKSEKQSRMAENLAWQTSFTGNIGQVYQKDRDPNLFYGGTVTTGLWHKKLKGGIETGLGWENYLDYGSVTNHIRIVDSIPGDSLNPPGYKDTTQVSANKYRYQYLQVPLLITKQVMQKGKFSFDITTGPRLGIMISQKKMPDYTSGPENGEILSTDDNDYSRLKTSWQCQVMARFRWNFSDRLSLELSPGITFYLNNLYERDNRPTGMPYGIGINGGLIYRFK